MKCYQRVKWWNFSREQIHIMLSTQKLGSIWNPCPFLSWATNWCNVYFVKRHLYLKKKISYLLYYSYKILKLYIHDIIIIRWFLYVSFVQLVWVVWFKDICNWKINCQDDNTSSILILKYGEKDKNRHRKRFSFYLYASAFVCQ